MWGLDQSIEAQTEIKLGQKPQEKIEDYRVEKTGSDARHFEKYFRFKACKLYVRS